MITGIPDPYGFIRDTKITVGSIVIDIVLVHLPAGLCISSYKLFAGRVEGWNLYLEFNFEH
jgi:hypothetical protein